MSLLLLLVSTIVVVGGWRWWCVVTVVDSDGNSWWWPFDTGDAAVLGWSTMVVRRKALLIIDDTKLGIGVC
jgi:hypothetical protein